VESDGQRRVVHGRSSTARRRRPTGRTKFPELFIEWRPAKKSYRRAPKPQLARISLLKFDDGKGGTTMLELAIAALILIAQILVGQGGGV